MKTYSCPRTRMLRSYGKYIKGFTLVTLRLEYMYSAMAIYSSLRAGVQLFCNSFAMFKIYFKLHGNVIRFQQLGKINQEEMHRVHGDMMMMLKIN